jgi:hypothetical protein
MPPEYVERSGESKQPTGFEMHARESDEAAAIGPQICDWGVVRLAVPTLSRERQWLLNPGAVTGRGGWLELDLGAAMAT